MLLIHDIILLSNEYAQNAFMLLSTIQLNTL